MGYVVTLLDDALEVINDADGYTQEGPLTTFYRVDRGRQARLDAWSTRLLSLRTDHIAKIRLLQADIVELPGRPSVSSAPPPMQTRKLRPAAG